MAGKTVEETRTYTPAEKVVDEIVSSLLRGEVSFDDATEHSDGTAGGGLLSGEDVAALVKVPFAVIGGTFRTANDRNVEGSSVVGDYVSLECVIADDGRLKKAGVDLDEKPFGPLEIVRFNNGSTGVRRQVVRYLSMRGYVSVKKNMEGQQEGGKLGESVYDTPFHMWDVFHIGELGEDKEGGPVWDFKIPGLFIARRGLRESQFTFNKKQVTTYYFA